MVAVAVVLTLSIVVLHVAQDVIRVPISIYPVERVPSMYVSYDPIPPLGLQSMLLNQNLIHSILLIHSVIDQASVAFVSAILIVVAAAAVVVVVVVPTMMTTMMTHRYYYYYYCYFDVPGAGAAAVVVLAAAAEFDGWKFVRCDSAVVAHVAAFALVVQLFDFLNYCMLTWAA